MRLPFALVGLVSAALLVAGCKDETPEMDPRIKVFDPEQAKAQREAAKAAAANAPKPEPVSDGKERVTLRWKVDGASPILVRAHLASASGAQLDPAALAGGAKVDVASAVGGEGPRGASVSASVQALSSGELAVRAIAEGKPDEGALLSSGAAALEKEGKTRANMSARGFVTSELPPALRNLLALMLELPSEPVAVGETWRTSADLLDVPDTFLATRNVKRNEVKLTSIEEEGGKKVAVLEYVLAEDVAGTLNKAPGALARAFVGTAKFNVDDGRWSAFEGRAISNGSGELKSRSDERVSVTVLTQVPADLLKDPPPKPITFTTADPEDHGHEHGPQTLELDQGIVKPTDANPAKAVMQKRKR